MIPLIILAIEDESDRDFMTALYVQYHRLMYHEIYKLLHDPWATDDVLQATLVKLIDRIGQLRKMDQSHLINYIITACRNRAKNYLRDTNKHTAFSFDEGFDCPDSTNDQIEMEWRLIHNEELYGLSRIWPMLDERSQYLLEAKYILGKTAQEIAKELNLKPGSVRMLLTRARRTAFTLMNDTIGISE